MTVLCTILIAQMLHSSPVLTKTLAQGKLITTKGIGNRYVVDFSKQMREQNRVGVYDHVLVNPTDCVILSKD